MVLLLQEDIVYELGTFYGSSLMVNHSQPPWKLKTQESKVDNVLLINNHNTQGHGKKPKEIKGW
jgi:hypothetical protein